MTVSIFIYDAETESPEKLYNEKIKELRFKEIEVGIELKRKEAYTTTSKKQ